MKLVDLNRRGFVLGSPAGFDGFLSDVRVAGVDGLLVKEFPEAIEEIVGLAVERLVAVDAEVPLTGRLLVAPGAVDRADRFRGILGDVYPVDLSQLVLGGITEDGDVSAGDVTSSLPAVMFLQVGLTHPLGCKVGGTGLPEVGEVNRLLESSALARALDALPERLVGDVLSTSEFAPERDIGVVTIGMLFQPALEVRDAGDERDRSLSSLALDGDSESVLVVGDVPDGQGVHLTASAAGVPCDGQERRVARVERVVDQLQRLLPVDHLTGVWGGVVGVGELGWNPFEGFRSLITLGHNASERSDDATETGVRLLVVVSVVDPADEVLGLGTILEDLVEIDIGELLSAEAGGVAGHHAAVLQCLVSGRHREVRRSEGHLIVEVKEELSISFGDTISRFDVLPNQLVLSFVVLRHPDRPTKSGDINLCVISESGKTTRLQGPNSTSTTGGVPA